MMARWWNSDIIVLFRRLAVVYGILAICRITFLLSNGEALLPLAAGEIWPLAKGAFLFDSISVVYAYGAFVLLSLLPLRLRGKRWYGRVLFWYFVVVTSAVAGFNLADSVYFHYTGVRITAADTMFAGNDNTWQLVVTFALENWPLVLEWIALTALAVWLWRYTGRPSTPIANGWAYFGVNTLILAAVTAGSVAVARGGGFSREIRPVTLTNAMAYTLSPAKANLILSNPFCFIRTLGSEGLEYRKYFTEKELAGIFTPYHYPADVPADSLAARRNVVIFVLESFSAEHSALLNPDLYPDGRGYTPFLDSLMREGYYFTRAFANGFKSIDALPSILGSMPSIGSPFVLRPQALGESMPLPKILAAEGYATSFFCGSGRGSMGFDAYAYGAEVKDIYAREDYDARYPGNGDYDGVWGIWDEPFLKFMGEVLGESRQPFFSTVFTTTSHHPFNVPAQYADSLPQGETLVQKPAAYTDMSIRRFFERYGGEPWFRNTVFVFAADHVSSETFALKTATPVGRTHIISFVYIPDGSLRGRDDHIFQQADIMPSVLGILGYGKPYFAFGRDVFREPERMPMAVNYSQRYQVISDSLSMTFDGERILETYLMSDTLQANNIASQEDTCQLALKRRLEAFIQQYYGHIERKTYVVPEE